jgi:phosphoacetylglucosamine mutase
MTAVHVPEALLKVLAEHPLPDSYHYNYGTAGFRTIGDRIPAVAARMALLVYLRAATSTRDGPRRMGVMITASHNAAEDNGLKIVDLDGGMLAMAFEPHATALANASSDMAYIESTRRLAEFIGDSASKYVAAFPALTEEELTVIVGYDTRPSSIAVSKAVFQAFDALQVKYVNLKEVTTPEVHHEVYYGKQSTPWATLIAQSFRELIQLLPADVKHHKRVLAVDCANGVGAKAIPRVLAELKGTAADLYSIHLACADVDQHHLLNEKCGADFAQKGRQPPEPMYGAVQSAFEKAKHGQEAAGSLDATFGVYSLDGDADRLVGFQCLENGELKPAGHGELLDGDRIIALIAMALKDIADRLGDDFAFTTGIVQTAYANGGSTKFIRDTLGLNIVISATGVKYTHHDATHYDVGIYFEANGHGTLLIDENGRHPAQEARDDRMLQRLRKLADGGHGQAATAARELLLFGQLLSQSCGDAIANLFAIEYALRRLGLDFRRWLELYNDLPSKQLKVGSSNHRVVHTIPNETKATAPTGLQEAIDAAVKAYGGALGRAFVRPSGTEPIIRVYAEAATQEQCDALAAAVVAAVEKYAP